MIGQKVRIEALETALVVARVALDEAATAGTIEEVYEIALNALVETAPVAAGGV